VMTDLKMLYQELIIDHGIRPRNFGVLENATCEKEGYNPLCGDRVKIYLIEKDGVVEDVMFEGSGCAISMASASLMTEALKGKTIEEVKTLFNAFHRRVTEGDGGQLNGSEHESVTEKFPKPEIGSLDVEAKTLKRVELGKLEVLGGVSAFPMRVKCATLAWHAAVEALEEGRGGL